jgi:uncharacterized membrane protein YidH (DUF202 family)
MLTTVAAISPDANVALLAAGALRWASQGCEQRQGSLREEFLAVALFSVIGLLVSLIAVFLGEPGVWL